MTKVHEIVCVCWNVRGLNDPGKCDRVLSDLRSSRPQLVALQETKLDKPSHHKLRSLLPPATFLRTRLLTQMALRAAFSQHGIPPSLAF